MSAETSTPLPIPRGSAVDDTIRRTVEALIAGRELKVETVARAVDMTPATFYRRLAGKGRQQAFAAGEVSDLAAYFGLDVRDLYSGIGGLFTPPPTPPAYTGDTRRYLRLVRGALSRSATGTLTPVVTPRNRHLTAA